MLDTSYHVETPESIDLTAQVVGPVSRVLAYALDLLIRLFVLLLMLMLLAFMGAAGWGVFAILAFIFEWFYPVLFEVLRQGQTPGKKAMKIAVVNDDLTPVTWSTSLIRNLLRAADILPFGYVLGLSCMCSSQHFQRLGDLAAGSIVIHRRDNSDIAIDLPDVPSQSPPISLSIEDQVALTGYVQRHAQLSEGRKQELADILQELSPKEGAEGVRYIQGIGNWLLGSRK